MGTPFEHSSQNLIILSGTGNHYYGGELHTFNPENLSDSFIPLHFKSEGARPIGPLCLASDGNYYGLCSIGAFPEDNLGYGAGFKYNPSNHSYTRLFTFEGTVVRSATGIFTEGDTGKLYVLVVGSQGGRPRIIQYDINTDELTVVVNFTNLDGDIPSNGLLKASNGKLYGTTTNGGGGGSIGTLFEFDPATLQFSTRYRFNNQAIGAQPYGTLIQVAPDKLIGTTLSGGFTISGTIYEFTISTGVVVLKQTFNSSNGAKPYGGLIDGGDGLLYGTTSEGGTENEGTIYSYNFVNNTIQTLASFGSFDLNHPYCNLTIASDGWLYGVTNGNNVRGGLFRYSPSNQQLELIRQFRNNEGYGAIYNHQLQELNGVLTTNSIPTTLCYGSSFYVKFACSSSFPTDHVFSAELSDSNGSFINPLIIGSVVSSTADSVLVTIPSSIPLGIGYRIRVRAEDDSMLSIDNGFDITIGTPVLGSVNLDLINQEPICAGEELQFQAYISGFTNSCQWFLNDVAFFNSGLSFISNSLVQGDVISVKLNPGTGCFTQTQYVSNSIYVDYFSNALPSVDLVVPTSFCEGSIIDINTNDYASGNLPTYNWYLNGQQQIISNSMISIPLSIELNNQTLWVEMTSSLTCVSQSSVFSDTLVFDIHEIDQTDVYVNLVSGDSVFVGGAWQYEAGTYTDILTNTFGCDSIIQTYVDIILDDGNLTNSNDWIFHSNIEWGTIQFGLLNSIEFNWALYDILGRKVKAGTSNSLVELHVEDLTSGVYVLRIDSGIRNHTQKWIK